MKKVVICEKGTGAGGVKTALVDFLNYYSQKSDIEITLVLLRESSALLEVIPKNIKVIKLPFKREFYNVYESKSNIKPCNRLIRKLYKAIEKIIRYTTKQFSKTYDFFLKKTYSLDGEYDVAMDYYGYGCFSTAYVAKKINAKEKIMWVHPADFSWGKNTEKYFKDYDKIYCVSDSTKDKFIDEFKYMADKVEVHKNIIDFNRILTLSKEGRTNLSNDYFNILTVARLVKEKGYEIIINAAKIIAEKNIKFRWYICGDGLLKDELKSMIKQLNIEDKIILLGGIENPYPYFTDCDIYVQASRNEGYGLTIAEAKILSKPVICSDIPPFREQIEDGKNGFLCDLTPESFANKIIYVYKNFDAINKSVNEVSRQEQEFIDDIL